MSQGWISLHRQIWDNEYLWNDKPFARGQAWIDLIMMANHEDRETIISKKPVLVKRGQRITSIRTLAERWGWSRHKVVDFLNALQSLQMAKIESDTKKTVVTIANYNNFQDLDKQKGHKRDTEGTPRDTNNNDNNENKYNTIVDMRASEQNDFGRVMDYYMQHISGALPSSSAIEDYKQFLETMDVAVILSAIDRAVDNNVRKQSYIRGILQDWRKNGVKTLLDVANMDIARQQSLQQPPQTIKKRNEIRGGTQYAPPDEAEVERLRRLTESLGGNT